MKVIDVQAKDVHVILELSLAEINLISLALSKCKIDFDGKDMQQKSAIEKLEQFSTLLSEIIEDTDVS